MKSTNIILSSLIAVLGLILLINPLTSLAVIVVCAGVWIILTSLNDIYEAYKTSENPYFRRAILIRALISIAIGLAAVILPIKSAGTIIELCLTILAIYFIFKALLSLFLIFTANAGTAINRQMLFTVMQSVLAAVILFLLNGESVAEVIMRIIGAVLLSGGLITAVYYFRRHI